METITNTLTDPATGATYDLGPGRSESGDSYTYEHHFEAIALLDADAGPCKDCDLPMARLRVAQHVNHSGYVYTQTSEHHYAHRSGAGPCSDSIMAVKPKCPSCGEYGTLSTRQLGYGDQTDCLAPDCDYQTYYSIGD